mmetsp:Transcript_10966/g.16273  ORF Transcript_10966/g.16273 Transcript_10966/m.16273 type:complete len:92 (+) Transcript_10966:38-313(+)
MWLNDVIHFLSLFSLVPTLSRDLVFFQIVSHLLTSLNDVFQFPPLLYQLQCCSRDFIQFCYTHPNVFSSVTKKLLHLLPASLPKFSTTPPS